MHPLAKLESVNEDIDPPTVYDHTPYPCPFDSQLKVKVELPQNSNIDIDIVYIYGGTYHWVDGWLPMGEYVFGMNTLDFGSGIYYIRLIANGDNGGHYEQTIDCHRLA